MNLKLVALFIVSFGVITRLLPHQPNIVPITALCLFTGAYLPRKFAFLPLLALLISDYFIGFYGIDMLYVYGSYMLTAVIGFWLKSRKSAKWVLLSSLSASVLFFVITNFGVWAPPNNWYTHDLSGLTQSYIAALPFFRNSLIGDVGYSLILFGSYEMVMRLARRFFTQKLFQLLY